jgi:hypothetical protein
MKITELFENKASKNLTRAEKDAKRATKKSEVDKELKAASDRLKADKQAKLDAYYDGAPMKIKLKVWTDLDPKTGKRRSEMREFTIDNKQNVRAQLSDVELQDMRYLENADARKETYAIKTGDAKHFTGSIPEYLFDLPKRTRKKKGADPRDLRREVYDA